VLTIPISALVSAAVYWFLREIVRLEAITEV
jgi:hypothetical protein